MLMLLYKICGTFPYYCRSFCPESLPVTTTKAFHIVDGASDRRSAIDFGLTDRALRFAQFYAANPQWGVTACATYAGYSDRGRAAHVRGCELLRDPRVIRAIIHFGSLELAEAQAQATSRLRWFADGRNYYLDGWTIRNLTIDLRLLAARTDHLAKIIDART